MQLSNIKVSFKRNLCPSKAKKKNRRLTNSKLTALHFRKKILWLPADEGDELSCLGQETRNRQIMMRRSGKYFSNNNNNCLWTGATETISLFQFAVALAFIRLFISMEIINKYLSIPGINCAQKQKRMFCIFNEMQLVDTWKTANRRLKMWGLGSVDKPFAELDLLLGTLQILFHEHEFSGHLFSSQAGKAGGVA